MRRPGLTIVTAMLLVIASAQAVASAQTAPQFAREDLFIVSTYDPARDPVADLAAAASLAKSSGRNILLDVGGDWCVWCHILDKYLADNKQVGDAFAASFVIMKVNWSPENKNVAFLSRFPKAAGYPHFFVLGPDAALLESKNTAELEQGDSYNKRKMLAFAKKWRRPQDD